GLIGRGGFAARHDDRVAECGGDGVVAGFATELDALADVDVFEGDPAHERVAFFDIGDDRVVDCALRIEGGIGAGGCEVDEVSGVGNGRRDAVEDGDVKGLTYVVFVEARAGDFDVGVEEQGSFKEEVSV